MLKVDKYGVYYEAPDPDDEIIEEPFPELEEPVIEKVLKKPMGRPKRK